MKISKVIVSIACSLGLLLAPVQADALLFGKFGLQEEMKMMPIGEVWEEFLSRSGVVNNYFAEVKKYENEVLLKR